MKKLVAAGLLVLALGSACSSGAATTGAATNDAARCEKLSDAASTADSSNPDDMAALGLVAIVAGTTLEGNDDLKAKAEAFKAELVATGDVSDIEAAIAYFEALAAYCASL